jgi:hypothetical protein
LVPWSRQTSEGLQMTQANEAQPKEREQASVRLTKVDTIRANKVSVTLGGVGQASADTITVDTGGIAAATAKSIEVTMGGVGLAQAEELDLNRGRVVAVSAGQATLQDTIVGLLLARETHGDVRVLLDRKSVALFGVAAGLVLGLIHLLSGNKSR